MLFQLKYTMDTVMFADSVEWCPIPPFLNVFVCATYQQKESSETDELASSNLGRKERVGCIYLLQLKSDISAEVEQTLDTAGILDMKWSDFLLNDRPVLAVVTAAGEVNVYELENVNSYHLKLLATAKMDRLSDKELLGLSVDWSKNPNHYEISVSDSHGNVSVFSLTSSNLTLKYHWNAHTFEAWITCFDRLNSSIVYSGGDDCMFFSFDTRCDNSRPQLINRHHEAGVTSLHCNPIEHQYLASGSYDETLRIWDVRHLKAPIKSINLGGGIWRIKWEPKSAKYLATACMYNHFQVIFDHENKLEVVSTFKENDSIAYGIDFSYLDLKQTEESQNQLQFLLAMCSFYDHKLFIGNLSCTEEATELS